MSEIDAAQQATIAMMMGRAARDAFGKFRVSQPQAIFDSKLISDAQPLYWDDAVVSGAGTSSTFNTNQSSVTLAVSNLTAGFRARQTFRRFNYQPGKGQLITMTGILGAAATGITRRIGLFDAKNGVFFRSGPLGTYIVERTFTSGVAVDTAVLQSAWNIDKMDGTGPSGLTMDWSKAQVFVMDFQWLGVGMCRYAIFSDGALRYVHQTFHANRFTLAYMSTPNLPVRYDVQNDGTGPAASVVCICAGVASEGGQEFTGATRGITRGTAPLVTLNDTAFYPLLSIRLRAGFEGASIKPLAIMALSTTNADLELALVLNPTIVGTALAFTAVPNSAIEADAVATSASKLTAGTGTLLETAIVSANSFVDVSHPSDFQIGASIAGVADILVLAVRRLTGTTETIYGAFNWRETA